MGNSLCLCRALSIYEFKSDRLLGAASAAMLGESRLKSLLRLCYPEHTEQEGILQRHILDALITPTHAAMAGAEVGFEQ